MNSEDLRILIIDNNKLRAAIIEDGLREGGHTHVSHIQEMDQLLRRIVEARPDVIIIDLENPKRDMLEHALMVSRSVRKPIAMFVDRTDLPMTEAAIDAGVSAYVVDGLRKDRVKPILDMAISRFNAVERMRHELEEAKNQISERKLIEKAKSILMNLHDIDEAEAYRRLRTAAMQQSRKISQVSESLIVAAGLLKNGDRS